MKKDESLRRVWVQWTVVIGSTIAYILLFHFFLDRIGVIISTLVLIPVAAVGIYFGRNAGMSAGLGFFVLNLILTELGGGTLAQVFQYWPGYLVILVMGYLTGNFREESVARQRIKAEIASRERFIVMTRMATRNLIGSKGGGDDYYHLSTHLTNMFVADYAYLIRWDESKKQAILIAATKSMESPFSPIVLEPEETKQVMEIMKSESPRAIKNAQDTAYLINPSPFKELASQTKSALIMPLVVKDYSFGVAILAFDSRRNFPQDEIEYVELAGSQVTLALSNVQQKIEIEAQLREARALSNIERALSETERIGTNKILQLIVDSARDLIRHAEESVIHLLDENGKALIPRAISGFNTGKRTSDRRRISLKEGVAGHVIATSETVNIGNINESPLYVHKDISPSYRSLLVSPVQSGGQPIGTISVQSNKYNAFSSSEAELLNALSTQAAIAIENTRLLETTRQGLKEVNALYRISQGLASSLNTDELINEVANLLQRNFGYYHVQIYLLDPITNDPVLKSGSGAIGARMLKENFRLPKGLGIVGYTVETAAPFVTNEVNKVMFFFRNPLLPDTQSEIAVPIKVDGKVVGAIDIQERPPRKLTDNDMQLVVAVADQLSVALQKAALYADLQTALKQEQTVRSQLVQSERLALVGRLLASVSHELNNPLQAIQNALFLLKDEEQLSPQGRQDLEVILSEAERMASLIERLRGAYRPGRVKDFRPFDINDLIEDVHTLISTFLRQKQIAFEFHPDPDLPPVSGMPDQMRQVVLNLFLNAIEVMKPGGRLIARTLNLPQQNEILFVVKDTGPGIEPELLPRIFDAFITDKQTGTGLGLTITRDIIEQHFGRIEAGNDPEGGAIFNVWLPVDGQGRE